MAKSLTQRSSSAPATRVLRASWAPPASVTAADIVAASVGLVSAPRFDIAAREEVFRIETLGLPWDIGGVVYSPIDEEHIPRGADGRRAGIFLLHGGGGDHRSMDPMARILSERLGYRVVTMTYPGQLYLPDESRDWPGDTIEPNVEPRTPIYAIDERVERDEYELVQDRSNPVFRAKYGTLFFLAAKEGTRFHARLASWPAAFEDAMRESCRRNFPEDMFSIYVHGHSTGGPFAHILLQRVANVAGLIGMESSPFGDFFSEMLQQRWDYPFNYITVRTWRDVARYRGPEAGAAGAARLPWLMEDIFEEWEAGKHEPNIKAQHIVQFASYQALRAAARANAARLGLDAEATTLLQDRFEAYPRPLRTPEARPIPPLLYAITRGSRDHTAERYRDILLPRLAQEPVPPKTSLVEFASGVHTYLKPEPELPFGLAPAIANLWHDAIRNGYFLAPVT